MPQIQYKYYNAKISSIPRTFAHNLHLPKDVNIESKGSIQISSIPHTFTHNLHLPKDGNIESKGSIQISPIPHTFA